MAFGLIAKSHEMKSEKEWPEDVILLLMWVPVCVRLGYSVWFHPTISAVVQRHFPGAPRYSAPLTAPRVKHHGAPSPIVEQLSCRPPRSTELLS